MKNTMPVELAPLTFVTDMFKFDLMCLPVMLCGMLYGGEGYCKQAIGFS